MEPLCVSNCWHTAEFPRIFLHRQYPLNEYNYCMRFGSRFATGIGLGEGCVAFDRDG